MRSATRRVLVNVVSSSALVGAPARRRILEAAGCRVAANAVVLPRMTVEAATLDLGPGTYIGAGSVFTGFGRFTTGRGVIIGPRFTAALSRHDVGTSEMRAGRVDYEGETVVGDGAWIGAGVVVAHFVHIGAGAVVAAGAVVIRDVPPDVLVAGVPARVVRQLGRT